MNARVSRLAAAAVGIALFFGVAAAPRAQQEFPPPSGKGRVVVVFSGATGPAHYATAAGAIAKLGYDVALFDGNAIVGTHGAAVKQFILEAQQQPGALPGKVALVGFSLGGGMALIYGTRLPDLVAVAIVWYPLTNVIRDVPAFASRLKVPVLMFAGENDQGTRRDPACCRIETAREIASTASGHGLPFAFVTYPDAQHDFVYGGEHYDAKAYDDALQRTAARLKASLGP
jgi:alpha-beta hydrolase superfamily lysophospholipase